MPGQLQASSAKRSDPPAPSSRHFAAIVRDATDAIISKNLDGIVQSWNPSATRLFGFTAEEMIGSPITTIIPPRLFGEEEIILANIRRGERPGTFESIRRRKDGKMIEVALTISPICNSRGKVVGASKIARDLRDKRDLVGEVVHRSKNTLAVVQAIAAQTLKTITPAEKKAFFGRLQALGREHDSLTERNWTSVDAVDTIERSFEPFVGETRERVTTSGPAVVLSSRMGLFLAMIVHELATNAIKYGSLSTHDGVVNLSWKETMEAGRSFLELHWREKGGPVVSAPATKGFGSRLMERILDAEQGSAELKFEKAGFECVLRMPTAGRPSGIGG